MKRQTDVLVIGAGAVGVCAAWYLHQDGRSVTLVDKGEIAGGCSGKNAGLVVPSHIIPLAAPGVIAQGLKWMFHPESPFYIKFRVSTDLISWLWHFSRACTAAQVQRSIPLLHQLTRSGLLLFRTLAAREGSDFGFQERGLLMLFQSGKGRRDCLKLVEPARTAGLEVTVHDGDGVRALEPRVPAATEGGIYFPMDAHLDPGLFVRNLAAALTADGMALHRGVEVLGFEKAGDRITGVQTSQGHFQPREVVLAAGAWSPTLARQLGLKLPVQPAKGYSITLRSPTTKPRIPIILSEPKVTITPFADGIRFGGTLELAGLDHSVNRRRIRPILRVIPEYFPEFDSAVMDWDQIWSGFRPCSPDGLPFLGRAPSCHNLIVATGHAMLGITQAPIAGKLVAELAAHRKPSMDLTALRPERFA